MSIEDDDTRRDVERKYRLKFDSWGTENGKYYAYTKLNVADFTVEAAALIANNPELVALSNNSNLLSFEVNDQNLLSHIREGMSYDTSAFSLEDYYF